MKIEIVDVNCVIDLNRVIKYRGDTLITKRVLLQKFINTLWKLDLSPELWRIK